MKIISQQGVSLLEVLISVLVLSVGLLGLGKLQLFSLKGSNDAHFHTVASFLASDLSDRMRINPDGVALAGYKMTSSESISICSGSAPKLCIGTSSCSALELATFDLYQISCGVKNGGYASSGLKHLLPSATMSVDCGGVVCNSNIQHTITLNWEETDNHDADESEQTRTLVWNILP